MMLRLTQYWGNSMLHLCFMFKFLVKIVNKTIRGI